MRENGFSSPVAATGTTTMKQIGEYSFEGCPMGRWGIFEGNSRKLQITPKELIECMANQCIDLTLEGKIPYTYSNMYLGGKRYGVSVSLHYNNSVEDVMSMVVVHSDNGTPAELIDKCDNYAISQFEKRGVIRNKSFAKRVKRDLISPDGAYYTTLGMYRETE